jgi:hypothetical protein
MMYFQRDEFPTQWDREFANRSPVQRFRRRSVLALEPWDWKAEARLSVFKAVTSMDSPLSLPASA